jgi:hypothetical protein
LAGLAEVAQTALLFGLFTAIGSACLPVRSVHVLALLRMAIIMHRIGVMRTLCGSFPIRLFNGSGDGSGSGFSFIRFWVLQSIPPFITVLMRMLLALPTPPRIIPFALLCITQRNGARVMLHMLEVILHLHPIPALTGIARQILIFHLLVLCMAALLRGDKLAVSLVIHATA